MARRRSNTRRAPSSCAISTPSAVNIVAPDSPDFGLVWASASGTLPLSTPVRKGTAGAGASAEATATTNLSISLTQRFMNGRFRITRKERKRQALAEAHRREEVARYRVKCEHCDQTIPLDAKLILQHLKKEHNRAGSHLERTIYRKVAIACQKLEHQPGNVRSSWSAVTDHSAPYVRQIPAGAVETNRSRH